MADNYGSGISGSPGRRWRWLASVYVAIVLSVSCSEDGRFKKKEEATVSNARRISWAWKVVRMRELYPDTVVLDELQRSLIDKIKNHGLDWQSDGEAVAYLELLEGADEKLVQDLSPADAWGQPYEFKIFDGYLVIRSSGADRVFDTSKYYYGSFPWLSGGDFVIVGGKNVRWTVGPKAPDWLEDNGFEE